MTSDPSALVQWTRADALELLALVVAPTATFLALVAVYLLGLSIVRMIGQA